MSEKNKHKQNENIENDNEQVENNAQQGAETEVEATNQSAETAEKETKTTADTTEENEVDALTAAQNEVEELKDKLLRTIAEFENYKRRTQKEKAELIFNGGEKTVSAILPVLDDMDRAMENAGKTDDAKTIEEGWALIAKKLLTALEGLGVKKIQVENADFNVDYHEAIAMVPGMSDDKKGKVIDCVQPGYMLNDKVIRHAKVAVGQ